MDTTEFGRLALPHMDALFRTARRLTRSNADAQDLVQQTFLEGFRSFRRLADHGLCRAWMFRILRNLWIEQETIRGRRPAFVVLTGGDTADEALWEAGNLENEIMTAGFSDEVDAALRALPEEFRTAVLLFDVEGLSYDEIAEVMSCPKGTVRSRLARGRGLLAARLKRAAAAKTQQGGS